MTADSPARMFRRFGWGLAQGINMTLEGTSHHKMAVQQQQLGEGMRRLAICRQCCNRLRPICACSAVLGVFILPRTENRIPVTALNRIFTPSVDVPYARISSFQPPAI